MSTNLMAAHNQWASRPADERFWNLDDLRAALSDVRDRSYERPSGVSRVRAEAVNLPAYDSPDLCLKGSRGPITLTHWSLGQLCRYADAPADYLRRLPAPLAAQCLNSGLEKYRSDDVQLLLHRNGSDDFTLRSMTTAYSRLWNVDVVNALVPATERGWMVPPARPAGDDPRARPATIADIVPGQDSFGLAVRPGDLIAPAGVYASDRDMFVFLVHPERIIDTGGLMRGVFIWNSEVGAGAFRVQTFLLEAVCGNHIVWGASDVQTLRIVHKGDNFKDIGWKLSSQLGKFAEADTSAERHMIQRARNHVLGKARQETVENLFNNKTIGLSKATIEV
jgi:hypothetical protein